MYWDSTIITKAYRQAVWCYASQWLLRGVGYHLEASKGPQRTITASGLFCHRPRSLPSWIREKETPYPREKTAVSFDKGESISKPHRAATRKAASNEHSQFLKLVFVCLRQSRTPLKVENQKQGGCDRRYFSPSTHDLEPIWKYPPLSGGWWPQATIPFREQL